MHGFGWGNGMMGWGFGGGIVSILVIVLLVAGGVLLFRWGSGTNGGSRLSGGRSAIDILKERYARGEISREEYEEMKSDIEDKR